MQYYDKKAERFFAPTDLPRTAGGGLCFLGEKTDHTSKESIDSWEGIYEKKEASDEKAYLEQFWKFAAKEPELYVYHSHILDIVNSLGDGGVALEVGCGTADMALLFNHYHRVWCYGVDISNQAVSRARERFSLIGEDPDLLSVADVTELPFADGALNLVFGKTVFEHFEEPELAAAEIARVLAPGGHLVLDVPNKRNSYWTFASERVRGHTHTTLAYTTEELSDFFLREGFEVCSTWGDGLMYTTPYILYKSFFKEKENREINGEGIGKKVGLGKRVEGGVTQGKWPPPLFFFDSIFKKSLRIFNRMANRWGWANSKTGVLVGIVARKKIHREEI